MGNRILTLSIKERYFTQIENKTKHVEYRKINPYWTKHIVGQEYDEIIIKCETPGVGDLDRILHRPWLGYRIQKGFIHEFWDNCPVDVYAIKVN